MSPPDADSLACWDAVETAARIRSGEVSAREVVEAAIARAEEAKHLGAVVTPTYEQARRAAGKAGTGPFAGVPTFIKDLAQVAGVATGWGSAAVGTYISRRTDPFIRRFEGTGAVSLGKSATSELGLTATTEPLGQPPCRNPWNPERNSGGSSGGSACMVASGVVPFALASDGGGSIRIPAACCGLVGLKPSRYRIDVEGSSLLPVNIATHGILTRTVRDTVAFYDALESRHPPRKVQPIGRVAAKPSRVLRIGVFVDAALGTPVHSENRAAASAAGRLCEALGHEVEAITCPFDGAVVEDFGLFWGFLAWVQKHGGKILTHWGFDKAKLEPSSDGLANHFATQKVSALAAIRRLRGFGRTYSQVMQSYDVLISPCIAEPAPPIGHLATDLPLDTVFERQQAFAPFTLFQNTAGAPAISLPLGKSADGLPIGVQFAAAPGNDRTLLELAFAIEASQPWNALAPREAWGRITTAR